MVQHGKKLVALVVVLVVVALVAFLWPRKARTPEPPGSPPPAETR